MIRKILLIPILVLLLTAASQAGGVFPVDQIYDFGGVGIDYLVYHTFEVVNKDSIPIRLDSVKVSCDCSRVWLIDSVLAPGDTGRLGLEFSTRDYYGRISKSLHLYTSSINSPLIEFFYLTTIGQWFMGLKPTPASLFFLPGKDKLTVKIHNPSVDKVLVKSTDTHNKLVNVKVLEDEADKGSDLVLEVTLSPEIRKGTINTSFRVVIGMPEDFPEPTIMSIPVKIARF